MEDNKSIKDCIQLINKLPIQNLDENINAISNLIYENDDLLNEFLQKVDNRTEVCNEDSLGDFIKCEQNRDGDSYRSPHSNYYFPPMEDGRYPRKDLRDLEVKLNKIFGLYSKSYYSPTTIASVYCWELGPEIEDGFAVCAAFKNEVKYEKEINAGRWDSTNLVNVSFEKDDSNNISVIFKLTTTVILHMSFNHPSCGNVILVGTVGRQKQEVHQTKTLNNDQFYINHIGSMIEETENELRNTIEEIYIKKTKEIIDTARFSPVIGKPNFDQANKLKDVFSHK